MGFYPARGPDASSYAKAIIHYERPGSFRELSSSVAGNVTVLINSEWSAVRAPGPCVLRRGRDVPPFPRNPLLACVRPTSASLPTLRCQILLTKLNTLLDNRKSQRRFDDGVHLRTGMRLPSEMLFSLAGTPTVVAIT